jgi:Vault protein inter-alpha-trypsin domain/von Willebrand factor type A domain
MASGSDGMVSWGRRGLALLAVVFAGCGGAAGGSGPVFGESPPADGPVVAAPEPSAVAESDWNKAPAPVAADGNVIAYTDPGELPKLLDAEKHPFPLEHTHVSAKITGYVADVEVRQTFGNEHEQPIEAVYVFPLPENSAVSAMKIEIGKRVIEAKIKRRDDARRIYEKAKNQGKTAALLEQERPNVFTQSVANIAPHEKIDVVIHYLQDLSYDAGNYEFVFPMVVGPRYSPGEKLGGLSTGTGTHADTTRVPDASRISPPIVGKGERSGHDISLELVADAGGAISDVMAPTHEVVTRTQADGTLHLTLAEKDSIPNRDFVLRYRVAKAEPEAVLYQSANRDKNGYFSLVVQPPKLDVDGLVGRREVLFVVDVSGSMTGTPLGLSKQAMRLALEQLRPVDTFNIITFAGGTSRAFPSSRPVNSATLGEAFALVDRMQAGGGTEMANAVDDALSPDVEPGRSRYVFFMTDGYVGNEAEIIAKAKRFREALEKKGQRARVFGFGVGSSVNRYLIDGLSSAGNGLAVYVTTREDPAAGVNRFFHYIDRAVLTNVAIDWGPARPSEILPKQTPDLFASHPIILHGRAVGGVSVPPVVTAKAGDRIVKIPVELDTVEDGDVLGKLWARAKITDLEQNLYEGSDAKSESAITELGLGFGLVTRFTSFVAVDNARRVGTGAPATVLQPAEEPEGVDVDMAGGERISMPGMAPPPPAEGSSDVMAMEQRAPHACGCRLADGSRARGPFLLLVGMIFALGLRRARRDA